ncbi:MAG: hypothetical protein H7070_06710 [Saprospiraceae bacterium]|nr:hypothetical protein [Pyrinomonadaceae bacterium]
MKTFEIEIPDEIYNRAIKHAEMMNITFDEFCCLSVEYFFAQEFGKKGYGKQKRNPITEKPSQTN